MLLSLPEDVVRRIPLASPETAVREFAEVMAGIRPGAAADLEALASEAVDSALREGAVLLAVVEPEGAAPALLTGVPLDAPASWDLDSAEALRDSVEDLAGPDVRETIVVRTGLGPAVIAQRVPGAEQVRDRRPLTLQLQAFIPEPGTARMLLLTLACPSLTGWAAHQLLFGRIVAAAGHDPDEPAPAGGYGQAWRGGQPDFGPVGAPDAVDPVLPGPGGVAGRDPGAAAVPEPVEPARPGTGARGPAAAQRPRRRRAAEDEESFEHHTFRLT